MKSKTKGLQKLTDSECIINALLDQDKISREDLKKLNKDELRQFSKILNKKLNELKGDAFDEFYFKIDEITDRDTKNQIWERNHNLITWSISVLMQEYGRMPSVAEIASKSELSRQTIYKHLKEYANEPQFLEMTEQFRFMTSKVLASVFNYAVDGDIKAARLYFDIVGNSVFGDRHGTMNNTQNNYIQINTVKISQESIKQLSAEQLNHIEAVLKKLVPTAA